MEQILDECYLVELKNLEFLYGILLHQRKMFQFSYYSPKLFNYMKKTLVFGVFVIFWCFWRVFFFNYI